MSLGCSATNCASSCRRSCVGAEERSAWSSVGSCRLGCTNAQSSQTGRLLRCSNSDWDGQRTKRNLRTKVSKPPKPTILDLSHRPHHRRLPRQRFSATPVMDGGRSNNGAGRGENNRCASMHRNRPHLGVSRCASWIVLQLPGPPCFRHVVEYFVGSRDPSTMSRSLFSR